MEVRQWFDSEWWWWWIKSTGRSELYAGTTLSVKWEFQEFMLTMEENGVFKFIIFCLHLPFDINKIWYSSFSFHSSPLFDAIILISRSPKKSHQPEDLKEKYLSRTLSQNSKDNTWPNKKRDPTTPPPPPPLLIHIWMCICAKTEEHLSLQSDFPNRYHGSQSRGFSRQRTDNKRGESDRGVTNKNNYWDVPDHRKEHN